MVSLADLTSWLAVPTVDQGVSDNLKIAIVTTVGGIIVALITAFVKTRERPAAGPDPVTTLTDYARKLAAAEDEAAKWRARFAQESADNLPLRVFVTRLGYNPRLIETGEETFDDVRFR